MQPDRVLSNGVYRILQEKTDELNWLMEHFKEKGCPYDSPDELIHDLLEDIIDVWVDAHRKNDPCKEGN